MKKIILSTALIGFLSFSFAQNNKVVSAWNYLGYKELDKAKEAIDAATTHTQTMSKSKTWFYRGKIYLAISESEKFQSISENALTVAFESYLKAFDFDTKKIDVNELNREFGRTINLLVNKGINQFNAKDYQGGANSFKNAIKGANKFGSIDSLSYFYGAVSLKNIGDNEGAIKYFNKCIEIDYQGAQAYYYLGEIYAATENKEEYANTIKAGRLKYPEDANLITSEINLYLQEDNAEEAVKTLTLAIEKDASNKTLLYARGNMYEKTKDLENAKKDYKSAIDLDPVYFDANYNLGALIFNEAVEMMSVINEIKDNTKYAEEKKKADAIFLQSIPYLEKAHEINPADKSTMISLKQLYVRTGETDKYNAIKEKLEN